MTRWRSVLLAFAVPVLLALAPSVQAQGTSSVVLFGVQGGQILSETNVQLRTEGQIVVAFHGDPGTGCAASGLCAYSGTVVVRPQTGAFGVVTYRRHGRIERQASLFLTSGPEQYYAAASVERLIPGQPPGLCADTESNAFGSPSTATHNGAVTIRMFAAVGNTLSTRCAGPRDADLTGAGPTATISLSRLARGHMTVDLRGTRSFASHGFAGTVSSTLLLILGKPSTNPSQPQFPPGINTTRVRNMTEQLTLTRLTGNLTATVQGVANPLVCRLLDSCALTGTIGFGQTAHAFTGSVLATGPATRPKQDFLAALGLSPGNPHGITVAVVGNWIQGPAVSALTQSGTTCTDSAPGGVMFMNLLPRGGRLTGFASAASWRTRCPGPILNSQSTPLLDATASRAALGHGTFTIGLAPSGSPVEDDGYTLAVQGHLSLVVRRGRIRQQVITQPVG